MRRVTVSISQGDYLKTIAEAESEGEAVIPATLAHWLKISRPAVTAALRRLERDGLVRTATGRVTLTRSGREIAERLLNRHHLIERMLAEMFGMEWYKVHEEAERLEHAVSEDFERRLAAVLGSGKPCPHGNTTGRDSPDERRRAGLLRLDEVDSAQDLVVSGVFERDRAFLEFLDNLGLRPGVRFRWLARGYDNTLRLRVGRGAVPLAQFAAARIWVKPV